MPEFQHENTDEIVCPWCGHQYQDSWEFSDDDKTDCDECEKQFTYHRIIDVTYDTEKATLMSDLRAALVAIQELHKPESHVCECGENHGPYCDHCQVDYPCATRRLADDALGGGQHE